MKNISGRNISGFLMIIAGGVLFMETMQQLFGERIVFLLSLAIFSIGLFVIGLALFLSEKK